MNTKEALIQSIHDRSEAILKIPENKLLSVNNLGVCLPETTQAYLILKQLLSSSIEALPYQLIEKINQSVLALNIFFSKIERPLVQCDNKTLITEKQLNIKELRDRVGDLIAVMPDVNSALNRPA